MYHYVVPALELNLLPDIPADFLKPVHLEWINRGTDRHLQPMTVTMLVRTLYSSNRLSKSVQHLHASAGLRLRFASAHDRRPSNRFVNEQGGPDEARVKFGNSEMATSLVARQRSIPNLASKS